MLRTGPVCRLLGLVLIAADIPLAAETADAKAPGGFAVESLFPGPGADPAVSNPPPVEVIQRTTVLAQGLRGPDGIAMQVDSGGLYVAMEEANAIVRTSRTDPGRWYMTIPPRFSSWMTRAMPRNGQGACGPRKDWRWIRTAYCMSWRMCQVAG